MSDVVTKRFSKSQKSWMYAITSKSIDMLSTEYRTALQQQVDHSTKINLLRLGNERETATHLKVIVKILDRTEAT